MRAEAVGQGTVIVARGRSEGSDRLVAGDDALAALQRSCGGELPGTVAIPALLELLRQCWSLRLKLARTIHAQDGENAISAWVEVEPGEAGCVISISQWRAAPLSADQDDHVGVAGEAMLSQLADFHVRLDARQGVLAIGRADPELQDLASRMQSAPGTPWTDFVQLPGAAHRQPLHWRLLDRAQVEIPGLDRRWEARIVPAPGRGSRGFDLYLLPAELDALPERAVASADSHGADLLQGVLGKDLAPALRQPVARIIANAETIRTRLAGPLADEYAGYAGDIAEAARHLADLVSDLADLEAIEAADFAPQREPLDLADAARRAAGLLGVRARERGIVIEVPAGDVRAPAIGEWRRVLQVLLNLIGNAVRYAPADTTVRLIVADGAQRASVTVADEGPGLAGEDCARVFEKFERLGRSGDGGSGLGLYISRRLARAMGGDLTVQSERGHGARFTLELPVA
jgi:signal transduction histidine kinase